MIIRRRTGSPLLWNRIVPHLITLLSLMLGLSAMRLAIEEHWQLAVGCIVVAGILDGFDGYVARRMGVDSAFGAQLDSLVDFVSFGVAPAMVLYWWSIETMGLIGWAICVGFSMCCGLRLARYQVSALIEDRPSWAAGYFIGVPAPVGAGLAMVPMYFSYAPIEGIDVTMLTPFVAGWTFLVAVLFISVMPTFSFRSVRLSKRMQVPALAFVGGICFFAFAKPWLTLVGISVFYLLSIPVSMWRWRVHAAANRPSDKAP